MKRFLTGFAATVALGIGLVGPASAAEMHYRLDAHAAHPAKPGIAGPVVTSAPLTPGVFYVAEVEGTLSYYVKQMWTRPFAPFDDICGYTRARPEYFSSSVDEAAQGEVGMDAETVFGRPCGDDGSGQSPQPGHWSNFEINSGDGTLYHHIEPMEGRRDTPTWSDAYDYAIKGAGNPAKFHLLDLAGKTRDNYGQLDIYVRAAVGDDCGHGGALELYKAFGFESYEACWDYMQSPAQYADTYTDAVAAQMAAAKKAAAKKAAAKKAARH